MTLNQATLTNFDKTLIFCDGGNYAFSDIVVHSGGMTWMTGEREYQVNSIVFDISSANLTLDNATVSNIFTNFSSPVIYMENDASSISKITLTISHSKFTGNVAN
jgi:hypothetical protein